MMPQQPSDPRTDMEVRLVALLLGEASPFEEAQLLQTIEQDPALRAFYREMQKTVGLVQQVARPAEAEAAQSSAPPLAQPRLSPARREALLAKMQSPPPDATATSTVTPAAPVITFPTPQAGGGKPAKIREKSWYSSLAFRLAALLLLLGLLSSLLLPLFVKAKARSQLGAQINAEKMAQLDRAIAASEARETAGRAEGLQIANGAVGRSADAPVSAAITPAEQDTRRNWVFLPGQSDADGTRQRELEVGQGNRNAGGYSFSGRPGESSPLARYSGVAGPGGGAGGGGAPAAPLAAGLSWHVDDAKGSAAAGGRMDVVHLADLDSVSKETPPAAAGFEALGLFAGGSPPPPPTAAPAPAPARPASIATPEFGTDAGLVNVPAPASGQPTDQRQAAHTKRDESRAGDLVVFWEDARQESAEVNRGLLRENLERAPQAPKDNAGWLGTTTVTGSVLPRGTVEGKKSAPGNEESSHLAASDFTVNLFVNTAVDPALRNQRNLQEAQAMQDFYARARVEPHSNVHQAGEAGDALGRKQVETSERFTSLSTLAPARPSPPPPAITPPPPGQPGKALATESEHLKARSERLAEQLNERARRATAQLEADKAEKPAATKLSVDLDDDARTDDKEQELRRRPAPAAPPLVHQMEVQTAPGSVANFSTFSLNVSDVAFKTAAASLRAGAWPDPNSIRVEEFINAFNYRDPAPVAGAPLAFAWEQTRHPFAHQRDLLRFSIQTAALGRQAAQPLNLVILLDNSGSMGRPDRVQITAAALRVLAEKLQPQDKFSVVAFARRAQLCADGVPGAQAGETLARILNLNPQGGTDLGAGLNLAYLTALKHFLPQGNNRVLLLTDGAANLGDVEPARLQGVVTTFRQRGVALDCFGIGWEGLADDLLEELARHGDGRYAFLNDPAQAGPEFAEKLAGALNVAASDVKTQVEFNAQRVTAYRQIGYAKHQLTREQFRDNTVDAAELSAAESGNAMYVLQINPQGSGPLGVVRVRYRVPGTGLYEEREWTLPYQPQPPALAQASPAMRLASVAALFGEYLARHPYAGEIQPRPLYAVLSGVPEFFAPDPRPKQLATMLQQAMTLGGRP